MHAPSAAGHHLQMPPDPEETPCRDVEEYLSDESENDDVIDNDLELLRLLRSQNVSLEDLVPTQPTKSARVSSQADDIHSSKDTNISPVRWDSTGTGAEQQSRSGLTLTALQGPTNLSSNNTTATFVDTTPSQSRLQDILKDNTLQDSAQQNDTGINSMDLRTEDDAIDTPYITTEERASLTKMIRDQAAKALTINRKYQKAALQQLQEVEKAYARNKALGAQLQALNDRQEAVERAPLILSTTKARLGPPYFVDRDGKTPPDNEDTIRRKKRPLIVTGKMRRWTDQERESLKAGVISENKRILFNEFTKAGNEAGIRSLQTAADIQMMLNTQGLNWSRISQRFVDTRTASECLIQWAGNDHPGINKAEWSSDEFAKLEDLVKKHQGHNWVQIALDLRTDRTGAQCFRQYQTKKMTKQISKEPWTEEEDGVLKEAVEMLGERSWQQVSYCFDNRSPAQCMERWKKSLNPSIRRGRWLEEEDGALRAALKVYGEGRWTKVAQHVLGRTDIQCRERYLNVLSPNLKMGPWTAEETELLANLVKEHGDKN
ncbi:Myb-like DNA-binding domain protein [Gamsiella multidivaricata]|nr:Myb-like DNA-binding domain protein [Gamsiella multidivaricata]